MWYARILLNARLYLLPSSPPGFPSRNGSLKISPDCVWCISIAKAATCEGYSHYATIGQCQGGRPPFCLVDGKLWEWDNNLENSTKTSFTKTKRSVCNALFSYRSKCEMLWVTKATISIISIITEVILFFSVNGHPNPLISPNILFCMMQLFCMTTNHVNTELTNPWSKAVQEHVNSIFENLSNWLFVCWIRIQILPALFQRAGY